jgi:probable AcnD-accessory protein PrpF
MRQRSIAAVYMRGGTSRGLFLRAADLSADSPAEMRSRDALLLRLMGSPDPYGTQTDGLGGATQGSSKVVIVAPSARADSDVEVLFGQVSIKEAIIDWSGNGGNLSAAVGPFAIHQGWVAVSPDQPRTTVRIWQLHQQKSILAHVPTHAGQVMEEGQFQEDGVAFPGAEISLEYLDPADDGRDGLLPTGKPSDTLDISGIGPVRVSLINAGQPTVFVRADALGLSGREMPEALHRDKALLARLEAIRAHAAVAMRLAKTPEDASQYRQASPRISFVAPPASYRSSSGTDISRDAIDVLARIFTLGKMHPGYTGTGSIALAVAAALPGSVVSEVTRTLPGVPTRIGHVAGVLAVGAFLSQGKRGWRVDKVVMSRSARRLMEGVVYAPC